MGPGKIATIGPYLVVAWYGHPSLGDTDRALWLRSSGPISSFQKLQTQGGHSSLALSVSGEIAVLSHEDNTLFRYNLGGIVMAEPVVLPFEGDAHRNNRLTYSSEVLWLIASEGDADGLPLLRFTGETYEQFSISSGSAGAHRGWGIASLQDENIAVMWEEIDYLPTFGRTLWLGIVGQNGDCVVEPTQMGPSIDDPNYVPSHEMVASEDGFIVLSSETGFHRFNSDLTEIGEPITVFPVSGFRWADRVVERPQGGFVLWNGGSYSADILVFPKLRFRE